MSFAPVESVGTVQRRKRLAFGLTLRQVAKTMKISHVYLRDIEESHRFFSDDLRQRNNRAIRELRKKNQPNVSPSSP